MRNYVTDHFNVAARVRYTSQAESFENLLPVCGFFHLLQVTQKTFWFGEI